MLIIFPANYEAYVGDSEAPVTLQEVWKDIKVAGLPELMNWHFQQLNKLGVRAR